MRHFDAPETFPSQLAVFAINLLAGLGTRSTQGEAFVAYPFEESLAADKRRMVSQVNAAMDFIGDSPAMAEENRSWFVDDIRKALDVVAGDELTIAEIAVLISILGPAYSRVLSRPLSPPSPRLRAV